MPIPAEQGASPAPSPSAADKGSSPAAEFSLAGDKSIAENFAAFSESRNSKAEGPTEPAISGEDSPDANGEQSSSEQSFEAKADEAKAEKDKAERDGQVSKGVQKRIDQLTHKLKAEQSRAKEMALENAKLKEATRLFQEELARVSKFAKLDPHQEEIRQLKLEQEISQLDQRLPQEVESRFAEQERQFQVQERAQEIKQALQDATQAWDGLFTMRELGTYMSQKGIYDAEQAAQELGETRLQAAQKRIQKPKAPATAASSTSGHREQSQPWRYDGVSSISQFISEQEARRTGLKG